EHMERALRDIVEFSRNEDGAYVERAWPEEYWPAQPEPGPGEWERSVSSYLRTRAEMEMLISDEKHDLFAPFPWAEKQTLLREALLAADHAAHHLGQLVELR